MIPVDESGGSSASGKIRVEKIPDRARADRDFRWTHEDLKYTEVA